MFWSDPQIDHLGIEIDEFNLTGYFKVTILILNCVF